MQKVRVPITVDPVKCAGKQLSYLGLVPGQNLARIQELLLKPCADVDVEIWFDIDQQNVKHLTGTAAVNVCVACERCGDPLELDIQAEFAYAPITKRQTAETMPEAYEPIELDDLGEVNLHQIVEDELMLAMPVVVKHDEQACRIKADAMQWGELDEAAEAESNPFAVLQELKRK